MQSFRTELENPIVEKDILELEKKIRLFREGKMDEEKFRSLRLARFFRACRIRRALRHRRRRRVEIRLRVRHHRGHGGKRLGIIIGGVPKQESVPVVRVGRTNLFQDVFW